ncbi:AraC family transcriptional regulator [Caulobacter sp. CCNWLY153]|uniref:AraC family transcriptional regulator n=1 Tax=unclassified Caulobacter TaxID=2648921 RepID=UPI002FF1C979
MFATQTMTARAAQTGETSRSFAPREDVQVSALPKRIADLLRDAQRAAREDRSEAERRIQEAMALVQREGLRLLEAAAPGELDRGGLAPWQMRRIDAHLSANLDGSMRVTDLAAIAKLSVSHFSRAFAASYGMAPRDHILNLRLEQARTMMLDSAEPLGRIAIACGFSDQAHLSNRFRRAFDISPNAWRRQNLRGAAPADINAADPAYA